MVKTEVGVGCHLNVQICYPRRQFIFHSHFATLPTDDIFFGDHQFSALIFLRLREAKSQCLWQRFWRTAVNEETISIFRAQLTPIDVVRVDAKTPYEIILHKFCSPPPPINVRIGKISLVALTNDDVTF